VLSYLFLTKKTHKREYRYRKKMNSLKDREDKYRFVHEKNYAWEFRFPDSLIDKDNSILCGITLVSLVLIDNGCSVNFSREAQERYRDIARDGSFKVYSNYELKFNEVLRKIKPVITKFSEQLKIDLEKSLAYRFFEPAHKKNLFFEDFS